LRQRGKIGATLVVALFLPALFTPQISAIEPNYVAGIFERYIEKKELANPSVIVLDQSSGEIVFAKSANSLRKPASVQKILAAVSALTFIDPVETFTTTVSLGQQTRTLVIEGSRDPWVSFNHKEALRLGRASLPRIEYNSLSALQEVNAEPISKATIYYSNLYSQEVAHIKAFYKKHGITASLKRVSPREAAELKADEILQTHSPELQRMLAFFLTWSDNVLTERIARLAALRAGQSFDEDGVAITFAGILESYGIDSSPLLVKDASGLSHDNRITAAQVGSLLLKIRNDPQFLPVVSGLPISGITGTLKDRFTKTAPEAVGLVKAKTGTLNGTTNLAGYIESGDREYVFVIISDKHPRTYSAAKRARATVDRILGKIASPLLPQPSPQLSPEPAEIVINS
jgi:D-alanyl-D-alanine carboxypeptidase